MKLELKDNKVFFENEGSKKEIHPFWLRERVNGESFVDKATQQRLFDPTELQKNIQINSLKLSSKYLEITFNDGVHTKLVIQNILKEFLRRGGLRCQILSSSKISVGDLIKILN